MITGITVGAFSELQLVKATILWHFPKEETIQEHYQYLLSITNYSTDVRTANSYLNFDNGNIKQSVLSVASLF